MLIAAIWWWSARRSGQAPGNAELRESSVVPLQTLAAGTDSREREYREAPSPLEPLSIRTGEYERVPILDMPMMIDPQPAAATPIRMEAQPAPVAEPPSTNPGERQKIVTLRVCAVGDSRWPGTDLISALESQGLAYGRYQVYHRKHADGRSIFCVASLIEPGTFDAERMPDEEYRGVSMFAVLPGPLEALQAVDALFATARELARELAGTVQDAKGMPFSPQRVAALREEVARFQFSP